MVASIFYPCCVRSGKIPKPVKPSPVAARSPSNSSRHLFLSPERTYKRKIQEAAISIWVEHHLTKSEILTSYLNNVYLGSGATGLPAAAKLYFGKKVADLSLPEAGMLAGMINAPGQDDPFHDLDAARRRAAVVLDAMVANGKLTEEAALVAKLHPATPSPSEIVAALDRLVC